MEMEGTGRTLLRNRRFLERDPTFVTDVQVESLNCLKERACGVLEGLEQCQQSGGKEGRQRCRREAGKVLGPTVLVGNKAPRVWADVARGGVEEQQEKVLAKRLLRVCQAQPAWAKKGECRNRGRSVRFSDHVSFIGEEEEECLSLLSTVAGFQQWSAGLRGGSEEQQREAVSGAVEVQDP